MEEDSGSEGGFSSNIKSQSRVLSPYWKMDPDIAPIVGTRETLLVLMLLMLVCCLLKGGALG